MFGLFRSYNAENRELSEFLLENWKMKPTYADAFLNTYHKEVGGSLVLCRKRLSTAQKSADPGQSHAANTILGQEFPMALVTAAYGGYMNDLRQGKYEGTVVEKSIWAILSTRSDIVDQMDPSLGKHIARSFEEKFPGLFDEVFEG